MGLIQDLFGKSPFGPLVEHTKKVHECIEQIQPLIDAVIAEEYDELERIQNKVSKLEYEADRLKHAIRVQLPRRYFLPVERIELDNFLNRQDKIADYVEDFSVILTIRKTKVHPALQGKFRDLVNQVLQVTGTLLTAAVELENLAEVSFCGAEAMRVLEFLGGVGEEEWKADRIARQLSKDIYNLESELDPITIMFYEKMLLALSAIANEAENAGDMLRTMIVR